MNNNQQVALADNVLARREDGSKLMTCDDCGRAEWVPAMTIARCCDDCWQGPPSDEEAYYAAGLQHAAGYRN